MMMMMMMMIIIIIIIIIKDGNCQADLYVVHVTAMYLPSDKDYIKCQKKMNSNRTIQSD
jgi:hypothetical protein